MKNKFLLLSIFAALLAVVVYSLIGNEESKPVVAIDNAYLTTIQNQRKEKDTYLKTDKESPIEKKADFKGLKYFEVNPDFKVLAKLDILTTGQKINIAMTGGETEEYEAFANATFEIEGQKCALKIFKAEDGSLFLPFKDLTTNKETYGSGRYLDLDMRMIKDNQIEIDFNRCYHPYCRYHQFESPVFHRKKVDRFSFDTFVLVVTAFVFRIQDYLLVSKFFLFPPLRFYEEGHY